MGGAEPEQRRVQGQEGRGGGGAPGREGLRAPASRAEALLKLGHPSAAVADCEKALELNPDGGKAYKVAAKALLKTGAWETAYARVCTGVKLDYRRAAAAAEGEAEAPST